MKWNRKAGKRRFSQVFLIDGSVLSRIAGSVKCKPDDHIIEIGPGRGALTSYLLKKSSGVTAIEIDSDLIRYLQEKFQDEDRLKLINEDILKVDIEGIVNEIGETTAVWLCGNLPYDIGTAILLRLTPYRLRFRTAVFMLQREVVDRIVSSPGGSQYGFISAYTDYFFEKRKLFNVSPKSFRPSPAVHSTVMELKGKATGDSPEFEERLVDLLKISFAHKRKTLFNNLSSSGRIQANREELVKLLNETGIESLKRAEELDLGIFKKLSKELIKQGIFT
jgi:16S rRNA (adenine1518-N6/adenine1519-N6)-dimethyltransferase